MTTKLDRAIDQEIAQENARFLQDPQAVADARAEGELYRERLEAQGILPPLDPRHRPWCEACPWRNLDRMKADGQQYAIDHAKVEPDGFVCHTRLGPCDGPRIARVAPLREQGVER